MLVVYYKFYYQIKKIKNIYQKLLHYCYFRKLIEDESLDDK